MLLILTLLISGLLRKMSVFSKDYCVEGYCDKVIPVTKYRVFSTNNNKPDKKTALPGNKNPPC
jgi:hypothetical protein